MRAAIAADATHVLTAGMEGAARRPIASLRNHTRRPVAIVSGAACVLLVSGVATLVMQASLGQRASAIWMSALALATMTIVPLLMSRIARAHTTFATAMTLIAAMSAMNVVPPYVGKLEHSAAIAGMFVIVGGVLLCCRWHLVVARAAPSEDAERDRHRIKSTNQSTEPIYAIGATVLLALFAGLSSGMLARFQLVAICGVGSLQPMWQIALSLGAVCALSFIVDRSGNNNRMLIALYVSRATLIAALAAADVPTAALFAARVFVILDCLTIPALMKPRSKSNGVINAGCPGAAHHVGMILGATLSTTPYFFGDGFTMLYVSTAIANLICAVTLATRRWPLHEYLGHRPPGQTDPPSTKCKSGSMTALSLRRKVREDRFQMHHYRGCAGDPLKS
ncbi:MAG: hypothetical protein OSB38_35000 [Paraburkholderia fungorum]|nr:hypothetical protein [Paraburkholderia fungorum]